MAIEYADIHGRIILDIKGNAAGHAYGFKETYDIKATNDRDVLRAIGRSIAGFRARLLPNDHTIRGARYAEIGSKFKTLQLLDGAMDGTYPPDSVIAALGSNETVLNLTGTNATALGLDLRFQSTTELAVDDGDSTANFRFDGDGFSRVTRQFHAVPDLWENDWKQRGQDPEDAWFGVITYARGTVPATEANWWKNFYGFFDMMIAETVLVRKPGAGGVPLGTGESANKRYALCSIEQVAFTEMSERDVGRPSDSPVGRRLIRS